MLGVKSYTALGLSDEEYQKIISLLKRRPSLTELAMFSVEWSEHCGYIHSRKMLQLLPKTGKYPVLIGEDSGGIIVDGLAIVFKMESHNHPSQVEPKQGAATGVGGILRDIFTAGARPIALLDSLRFGSLKETYNRYLMCGVIDGIQFYGNCVGVPTVGGEIYFDECYNGNCLVNVMCIGVAKKNKIARAYAKGKGNLILYAGSSTGRDGIGGCSVLASQEFKKGQEKRPSVQIGDPFTEKCLIEATLEALSSGYVVGIKDMGAAGLTCASSEMAAAAKSGIEIDLKDVPRREKNMAPWEIMMSESQERMLLCIKRGKEKFIKEIFSKWGLNAVVIGKVIGNDIVRIKNKGKVVADVKASFLTDAPRYDACYKRPDYLDEINTLEMSKIAQPKDCNKVLLRLLGSPSIASKEWVYQQYDHMVQTNTIVLPGSDAAILRLKGLKKAIAATTDCNSRYCYLNPYRGAQIAVAEAARNLVCSGADPVAVTDCLNFGNPTKPERFWQFKRCVEGIVSACQFFNLAVVSGNVSFYNENPEGAIFPTPTIGMIGVINDLRKICTQHFKKENETIILLGVSKEELGGSDYLKLIHGQLKGDAPDLDLYLEETVERTVKETIKKGLVSSAHDCSEGGLAVALAESCISSKENMVGAVIDSLNFDIRLDALLFGESQSRVVISCRNDFVAEIKRIARRYKAPLCIIGRTGSRSLKILNNDNAVINISLEELSKYWRQGFKKYIKV